MAAVAMLCPLPQIFTWMQKCNAVGSISQMVDILHEERESYEEVAYVANNLAGAIGAAETGICFKNPAK